MYSSTRGRGYRGSRGSRRPSFDGFKRRDYGGSSRDDYNERTPTTNYYDGRNRGQYDNPRKRVRDQRDTSQNEYYGFTQDEPGPSTTDSNFRKDRPPPHLRGKEIDGFTQDEPGPSTTDSNFRKDRPPPHLRGKEIEIRKGFNREGSRNRRVNRGPVRGYKVRHGPRYHSPYRSTGAAVATVRYDSRMPSSDFDYWERRKKELDRNESHVGGEVNRYYSDDELSSDGSRDTERIFSANMESRRTTYNSYEVPTSRPRKKRVKPVRVFIRNLPMDFLKEHIVHDLTILGFKVRAVNRWKVLKIYHVQLTPTDNVMDVFKVKRIRGIDVSIVEPKTMSNKPKFLNQVFAPEIRD